MYAHIYAIFLAHRHYFSQEISHILAKLVTGDTVILLQKTTEYLDRIQISFLDIAVHKSLCLYDYGIDKVVLFCICNDLVQSLDLLQNFLGIISFRTFATKNLQIEICESRHIEIQGRGTVRPRMIKVCPYPVDHRHEIIADSLNSGFSKVSQTDLIIFYQPIPFRTSILDGLAYREAFHYRPAKSEAFNIVSQVFDCLQSPDLTVRNFVQSCDDALDTDLPEHIQSNLVLLTEPSPSLFHNPTS